MDIPFLDPSIERLPPDQTAILNLHAEPYPDGIRVRVNLELTPFIHPPCIELLINDPNGNEAGSASIVEPMGWKIDLTLHIRPSALNTGVFTLSALLTYPDIGVIDQVKTKFQI